MITTFSDFSVVSQNRITKINPKPNELIHYALFGCSVSVGLSTVEKLVKPKIKEKILLIGAGAIGPHLLYIIAKLKKLRLMLLKLERDRSYYQKNLVVLIPTKILKIKF